MVEIDNLKFRWQLNQDWVIDIPALTIATGETFYLQGSSGSGKSTLLNLVGGILQPDSGDIRVLGESLSAMTHARRDQFRADHVGFLFQMFNLVPYLSLLENVILPCRFSVRRRQNVLATGRSLEQEALRLLECLGVGESVAVCRKVTELSVGQQQRVAAARALIGAPELIIADEPTSALDSDARENFVQLLFNEVRASSATLLFVSHDPALAGLFDRTVGLRALNRAPAIGA